MSRDGVNPARVMVAECAVAGSQYGEAAVVWPSLGVGTLLEMRAEEDNPHDPLAVSLWLKADRRGAGNAGGVFREKAPEYLIGYLPREHNAMVYAVLAMGWEEALECRIARLDPAAASSEQITVTVAVVRRQAPQPRPRWSWGE